MHVKLVREEDELYLLGRFFACELYSKNGFKKIACNLLLV